MMILNSHSPSVFHKLHKFALETAAMTKLLKISPFQLALGKLPNRRNVP